MRSLERVKNCILTNKCSLIYAVRETHLALNDKLTHEQWV